MPPRKVCAPAARMRTLMRARLVMAAIGLVAACAALAAAPAGAQTASGMPPRPQQLGPYWITYYWFVPESAFTGARYTAKGLTTPYREDFLYSARGIAMQGTGVADDGKMLHWRSGAGAWVNKEGAETRTSASGFTNGSPYARPGGCVWWALDPATGRPNPATADNRRPTFPNEDGTWQNPPANQAAYAPVCDRARVAAGGEDDKSVRGYPDSFGIGMGTAVTEWRSIATDRSVIPKGSRIYIEALKDTPAKGCFSADDTGGAIIGKHIDVLVPYGTKGMPSKGDLLLLPEGVDCPPPTALAPGPLGDLSVSYLVPAAEAQSTAQRARARGMKGRFGEDFLYGTDGVVARSIGTTRKGRQLVARGGGWWVNAAGRKTMRRADGTWTKGPPKWREGGWRTRKGRPTYRRADGTWAWGVGVRYLRYRDRFRWAKAGEYVPWKSTAAAKTTAPAGTLLQVNGLGSAPCLVVNRAAELPANTIQVVVPAGTDLATLPTLGAATVLAADAATRDGCPG